MPAEYVPTTDEVERLWMHGYDGTAGYPKALRYEREAQWERFLATIRAEARAEVAREIRAISSRPNDGCSICHEQNKGMNYAATIAEGTP